ncbi:Pycsar system effector family protein [Desulfuromonas sp. CSMB_57]|uniref:Pycsar system effector family protein n=1 Tax=Desulfuromonas sp. CSMB_57 TaxID=2807629 RepID=UPI001CD63E59|nr:Pycsar system effector family protein [Desulfuromonas sp. CSMB_57]
MLETEQLQYILDKQLGWIASADSRLSLVLPLSTAMLGALALYAPQPSQWTLMAGIPAAFAIFFLGLSIVFCACASFPRTNGTKGSLTFFEGIVSRDLSQFRAAVKAAQSADLQDDLIQQCHINAQIASTKFSWVKRGMASMLIAMLPWAFAIYQFYGMTYGSV